MCPVGPILPGMPAQKLAIGLTLLMCVSVSEESSAGSLHYPWVGGFPKCNTHISSLQAPYFGKAHTPGTQLSCKALE